MFQHGDDLPGIAGGEACCFDARLYALQVIGVGEGYRSPEESGSPILIQPDGTSRAGL